MPRKRISALTILLAVVCGPPAVAHAQPSRLFVPASISQDASSFPLPEARAQAITKSGIVVNAGDVLTISSSGRARGGWWPAWTFFGPDGAPAGSQATSGPIDGGVFPDTVGAPANIYSLVATIVSPGSSAHLTGDGDEWFLVGTATSLVADRAGELQFTFHDALYRDEWASAYQDNAGGFNVTFGGSGRPGETGTASGGGWITDERHSFGFTARAVGGTTGPTGQVTYHDKEAGISIKSSSITGVSISGTHATITGAATVNGIRRDFRVDVDDLGEPGTTDRFTIEAGGYAGGGVLNGGNIQVDG